MEGESLPPRTPEHPERNTPATASSAIDALRRRCLVSIDIVVLRAHRTTLKGRADAGIRIETAAGTRRLVRTGRVVHDTAPSDGSHHDDGRSDQREWSTCRAQLVLRNLVIGDGRLVSGSSKGLCDRTNRASQFGPGQSPNSSCRARVGTVKREVRSPARRKSDRPASSAICTRSIC